MRVTACLFAAMGVCAPLAGLCAEPVRLLGCADWAVLDAAEPALGEALSALPDANCRDMALPHARLRECELARPASVFGLLTREVGSSRGQDGSVRVRSVFKVSAPRLRDAVAARLSLRFEPHGDDTWIATTADDPRNSVQVTQREDGSSLLICERAPPRDEASDLALGLDRERGGIAGRLSFPGGVRPPMRVCAVPRTAYQRARCVRTGAGAPDYLITGLDAGEYDVVSFAITDNPNRFIGAYASALEQCAPHQPGCAGGLLVPVRVRGGHVTTDIDPDRFYTDLPARFDLVRDERFDE